MAKLDLNKLTKEERIDLIAQQFLGDEVMKTYFEVLDNPEYDLTFSALPDKDDYTYFQLRSLASGQICVMLLGQNYMIRHMPSLDSTENTFKFNFINQKRKLDELRIHFDFSRR